MFKAAGIKPKDFANPRRATMIMSVIGMANLPEDENTCVPSILLTQQIDRTKIVSILQ